MKLLRDEQTMESEPCELLQQDFSRAMGLDEDSTQRIAELEMMARAVVEAEQAKAFLVKAAREQKIDPLASLALVLFNTNEFSYR